MAVLVAGTPGIGWAEEPAGEAESLSVKDPFTKRTLGQLTKSEEAILKHTNAARKKHGKAELAAVSHLTVIAQQHAINMARQQKMAHELDGKSVTDRLDGVKYRFTHFGENIAAGYRTEQATVEGWLNSPPHRANLLDENNVGYTQVGVGVHRDADGVVYCCQVLARPAAGTNYK